MKKTFSLVIALFAAGSLMAAPVQVLSNQKVAKGYYPQLTQDATELTYLSSERERYATDYTSNVYVTNEELKLVLYKNGTRTELYPHGTDVNYIWSSVSPDGTKILFNTRKGTAVCDLTGKELVNLGNYNSPVWYGNDYVVAALEENDGHNLTGGAVVILSLDGQLNQVLTDRVEIGMDPSTSYETGQIAYHDFDGNIHLMQINLAECAVSKSVLPALRKVVGVQPKAIRRIQNATKADFKDFKIYINPGHGGFDSDDRGMKVWLNETSQDYGFWESQSNLDKGLQLNKWLVDLGFQTMMSRTQNRTEDDRNLNAIAEEASNWGADFFLSIHTNAGGPSNYVLQLFAGVSPGDTRSYPSQPTPEHNQKSLEITTLMGNLQWSNEITTWNGRQEPYIAGDKTFAKDIMGWSNGYGVLRKLTVPGTISEGAMHDYYPETYRLMNMDYKHQEAWYFMKTFCTYFMNYQLPHGVIGGQVRDAFQKQIFPPIKRIKGSRDEQLPISGAKVTLLQGDKEVGSYTTDTCYNGVFFFWNLAPGTYKLRAEVEHYYTAEKEIEVVADDIVYHDFMMDMKRETPPEVVSYSPVIANIEDSIEVSTPIVLNFNWDMWEEPTLKAFSITPAVEGTLEMLNSQRTLQFTPKVGYEKATEYTVTLTTAACHPDTLFKNHLQKEFVLKFRTKNRSKMSVTQTYPVNGATDISLTPTIFLMTDNEIDTKTITNKQLVLTDAGGTEVAISSRAIKKNTVPEPYGSILFDVSTELKPNTAYTLTVAATVADINNVALNTPYVLKFTTGAGEEKVNGDILNELDSACFYVDEEKTIGLKNKKIIISTSKRTSGKASNQVEYAFNGVEADEAIFLKPFDLTQVFSNVDTIALDVYGDLSYNTVYVEFMTEGDVKLLPLCELDFNGWQHFAIDLEDLPAGVDYNFTGLKVAKGTNLLSVQGTIYLDALRRILGDKTALEDVEFGPEMVTKIIENNQVIVIRDGVRYNVLGTVVE